MKRYKHISRTESIEVNGPIEIVFTLFTPEGEKKWADGWNYQLIYPEDGQICEGFTFSTNRHDHNGGEAIWIISRYNPKMHQICYYRIEPSVKFGVIQISCCRIKNNYTKITITYTYTALSTKGNHFIESFSENEYRKYVQTWAEAINYYLKTGQILRIKHTEDT